MSIVALFKSGFFPDVVSFKYPVLSVIALVMLLVCGSAAAASSGTCGEHLTWTLDRKGHLTIEGTGDMTDWTANNPSPWGINITSVTIRSAGVCASFSRASCPSAASVTR